MNTGLYYLRARYMNPSTGTFISMDNYEGSIYDPVSLHKYLYANANPVMYTDPSGYATDKNLAETAVAATIAVMLASSVALHNQAMLNIFSTLRKNMADTVMSLPCTVSVTDWKNVILGFPAHEFDTKWLITIPMALSSWQLFEAIYATDEDTNNLPGVPENQEEKNRVESIPAEEKDGPKIYQDKYVGESLRPEAAITGSKKHGIHWKEGPARAKKTGKPQGQWAEKDLEYATRMASTLKAGESATFDLPLNSESIVHMPNGSTKKATKIWIRNNGTGTWHGYPTL